MTTVFILTRDRFNWWSVNLCGEIGLEGDGPESDWDYFWLLFDDFLRSVYPKLSNTYRIG